MSTVGATFAPGRLPVPVPAPSWPGAVRAEIRKLAGQRSLWAMLAVAVLLVGLLALSLVTNDPSRRSYAHDPSGFMFLVSDVVQFAFTTGSGIVLLIVSARTVGMEYSAGTIRVLYARGGGRLRLLAAKLAAVSVLGLLLLAGYLALWAAALTAIAVIWAGTPHGLAAMPARVWQDAGLCVVTCLISMAASIVIGATAAVVGRSLAFGVGAALAFFPADNMADVILSLLHTFTGRQVWLDLSGFLLGPNLDALSKALIRDHTVHSPMLQPFVTVDTRHALLVIGLWLAGMLGLAVALVRRRDVLE
ncbi:MAG: ABC transporter permease [Candidatus Dormibacteraeota bacterium]|nr:ABC transporter permease [Candidatus Dormibacteraeota bacterium]